MNKLLVIVAIFVVGVLRAVDKDLTEWAKSDTISGERQAFDWATAGRRWLYGGLAGLAGGGLLSAAVKD